MKGCRVQVHDLMQRKYTYVLTEPSGRNFHPLFRPQLTPMQMLELGVSKTTFQLSCAPVINLFDQVAEPILMEQKKFDYRIIPDARREEALDIFSVDEVVGVMSGSSVNAIFLLPKSDARYE